MSIGSHQTRSRGTSDSYITPRSIIEAVGPFDLDPCACIPQPWPCAEHSYNVNDNGLLKRWFGRVWLNPPYGRRCAEWLAMLATHGNGIALIFARTDTAMFHDYVFSKARGLLFLRGRITFHRPDGSGTKHGHNSGGPSVLIAYGDENSRRLKACGLAGQFVELDPADEP